MVWRKMGNTIKRAVRCTSGRRKGLVVSNRTMFRSELQKRLTLKRTKAKMGARMARKALKNKKVQSASRRVRSLNRRR